MATVPCRLITMQPTERFSGLAGLYQKSRPGYPEAAIDFVLEHCRLSGLSLIADVGCGTGIASRIFAARGIQVIGIEPNDDMRSTAESHIESPPNLIYKKAAAEATGLDAASLDAVLAAQAFHWFNAAAALQEFHRILKPGGFVVLMWNERDTGDQFTKEYGSLFESMSEGFSIDQWKGAVGQPLLESNLFTNAARHAFSNAQEMDLEGLLARAFSASYAPRHGERREQLKDGLQSLFSKFEQNGHVILVYTTSVY